MTGPLRALYFPWIAIHGLNTLKKALIYFDTVSVLSPPYHHAEILARATDALPERFRPALHAFQEFREHAIALQDADALELLDPYAFGVPRLVAEEQIPDSRGYAYTYSATPDISSHLAKIRRKVPELDERSRMLSASIVADLADETFCALPTPLEVFFDGNLIFDYAEAGWTFSEFHGYDLHEFGDAFRRGARDSGGVPLQESLFDERYGSRMMAYLGQSLIINRTLIAADALDVVPFTDQLDQFAFLRNKYARLYGGHGGGREDRTRSLDARTQGLALRIVDAQVPNLVDLEWHDILEIRAHAYDELAHFRIEVAKFAADMQADPGTPEFDREAELIMAKTVAPAVKELELKLRLSRLEVLQQSISKAQSLKPTIPFAVSFFLQAPLIVAVAAAGTALGADIASKVVLEKRKHKSATGMSYLLNFK